MLRNRSLPKRTFQLPHCTASAPTTLQERLRPSPPLAAQHGFQAFTRQLPACPSGLVSHTPIFSAIFRGDSGCNSSSVGRKEDPLNHLPLILLSETSPQPTSPCSLLSVQEVLGRGRWLTSQVSAAVTHSPTIPLPAVPHPPGVAIWTSGPLELMLHGTALGLANLHL